MCNIRQLEHRLDVPKECDGLVKSKLSRIYWVHFFGGLFCSKWQELSTIIGKKKKDLTLKNLVSLWVCVHDVVVFVCGYMCEYVYVCATTYVWRSEGKLSGQSLSFTSFKTGAQGCFVCDNSWPTSLREDRASLRLCSRGMVDTHYLVCLHGFCGSKLRYSFLFKKCGKYAEPSPQP